MRGLRWGVLGVLLLLVGCRGGLMVMERPTGQIKMQHPEQLPDSVVRLNPATASLSDGGIDVTVRYAPQEELDSFFSKKKIFGKLAGRSPYPPQTLVFYIRVFNHSGKLIYVDPADFVLIDNINVQYSELSPDNISALLESRVSVWSFAKTTGDLAPGPYGAPLKVASALGSGGGRKLHYLIKQVRLSPGYVHPGIAYDGYVAFPYPHPNADSIRLLIYNIKTDFDAADEPQNAIHFEFPLRLEKEPS
jgi:hypothetical protein